MNHFVWNVNPEIFTFGALSPRWYGLMFALGFFLSYNIVARVYKNEGRSEEQLSSLLMHVILGTIIGARLGHCLFYQPDYYLMRPWEILMIWQGGLASHGGFLGVAVALILYLRKYPDPPFWSLVDRIIPCFMLTAGFIRLGNFFNSEILGFPTDVPWAVIFAKVDNIPRHPAMLYEAIAYFLQFVLLQYLLSFTTIRKFPGRLTGIAAILGFSSRFVLEFFKENQVDFENQLPINMGQILSIPFVVFGIIVVIKSFKPKK